ncbi:hypothetical protein ACFQ60_24740 [Streptomyces zhihengii]
MTRLHTSRRARRALVPVLAASALLTLGAAAPASAESDQLWVYSDPYELVLPGAYEDGTAPERTVALKVSHDNIGNPVGAGRISVDAAELAAFATVRWPADCDVQDAATAVCDVPRSPAPTSSPPPSSRSPPCPAPRRTRPAPCATPPSTGT